MRVVLFSLAAICATACTPPQAEAPAEDAGPTMVEEAPAEAVALVQAAMPGFTIMTVEREDVSGQTEWEIAGADAQGTPYEFDIMQSAAGFSVLEIQRDIPWEETPQAVRAQSRPRPTVLNRCASLKAASPRTAASSMSCSRWTNPRTKP